MYIYFDENLIKSKLAKFSGMDIFKVMVMVFNTTFNIISAILCRSVLLEEKTGENH
jgi:hypothetical protein